MHSPLDLDQQRARVETVRPIILRLDARMELLLQARDTDLEELVQVGGEDGEKLEAFEQWGRRIAGLFKYSAVELQPAQLTVDVMLGGVARLGAIPLLDMKQGTYIPRPTGAAAIAV